MRILPCIAVRTIVKHDRPFRWLGAHRLALAQHALSFKALSAAGFAADLPVGNRRGKSAREIRLSIFSLAVFFPLLFMIPTRARQSTIQKNRMKIPFAMPDDLNPQFRSTTRLRFVFT